MRTIVPLPGLPAALPYCRSQIGRDGARLTAQGVVQFQLQMAVLNDHRHHRLALLPPHSLDINRPKAHQARSRAIAAAAKSP